MLFQREGFPDEDEFVLCTVTAVNPHSIFCSLDEFGGKTGLIHISEVAPGRIRNMREYVSEGKKVVCKVLRVDSQKGHIDLSLRRVNASQKKQKLDDIKREIFAEKIIELVAKKKKLDIPKLYSELSAVLLKKYDSLMDAFEKVSFEGLSLEKVGLEKSVSSELTEAIVARIKPVAVNIGGIIKMSSYAPDGFERVKAVLLKLEKSGGGSYLGYSGGGSYRLVITSEDYKSAEKLLSDAVNSASKLCKSSDITFEFLRSDEKK